MVRASAVSVRTPGAMTASTVPLSTRSTTPDFGRIGELLQRCRPVRPEHRVVPVDPGG